MMNPYPRVKRGGFFQKDGLPQPAAGPTHRPQPTTAWSYHEGDGWKPLEAGPEMPPLGVPAPEALAEAGYAETPSATGKRGLWVVYVYDHLTTPQHLVVILTAGRTQYLVAAGFPSLLEVLEKITKAAL